MEHVATIETVDDEGMGFTGVVLTIHDNGAVGHQFANQDFLEPGGSICALIDGVHIAGTIEIRGDGLDHIIPTGIGLGRLVVGKQRLTHIEDEVGHSVFLGTGGRHESIHHIAPVECSAFIHTRNVNLIGIGIITGDSHRQFGGHTVSERVEHLSQGYRKTACGRCLATHYRALGVVGVDLSPVARHQWRYGRIGRRLHVAGSVVLRVGEHRHPVQLILVRFKHGLETVLDVVGGDMTLVGIAEDGCGAVVARDDDESTVCTVVENIIIHFTIGSRSLRRCLHQCDVAYLCSNRQQEVFGLVLGLLNSDGTCRQFQGEGQ